MRLSEARRKYRNQWIAFVYSNPKKEIGRVLFHDKDRKRFDAKTLLNIKHLKHSYLFYTGPKPLLPKGWGLLLCMK